MARLTDPTSALSDKHGNLVTHLLGHRNTIHLIAVLTLILSCPGVSLGQVTSYAFVPGLGH